MWYLVDVCVDESTMSYNILKLKRIITLVVMFIYNYIP